MNFIKKASLIKIYFKLYWKILVISGVLISVISLIIFTFAISNNSQIFTYVKNPIIGNYQIFYQNNQESIEQGYRTFGEILRLQYFPIAGILLFSIPIILLINLIYVFEITNKTIILWMSSGKTRTQVIIGKLCFLILIFTIIYAPVYFMILIMASQAFDATTLFSRVFALATSFYCFMLILIGVYMLLAQWLSQKALYLNLIYCFILVYEITIFIIKDFFSNDHQQLGFLEWFTLQNLMLDLLKTKVNGSIIVQVDLKNDTSTVNFIASILDVNKVKSILPFTFGCLFGIISYYVNIIIFKRINLNI